MSRAKVLGGSLAMPVLILLAALSVSPRAWAELRLPPMTPIQATRTVCAIDPRLVARLQSAGVRTNAIYLREYVAAALKASFNARGCGVLFEGTTQVPDRDLTDDVVKRMVAMNVQEFGMPLDAPEIRFAANRGLCRLDYQRLGQLGKAQSDLQAAMTPALSKVGCVSAIPQQTLVTGFVGPDVPDATEAVIAALQPAAPASKPAAQGSDPLAEAKRTVCQLSMEDADNAIYRMKPALTQAPAYDAMLKSAVIETFNARNCGVATFGMRGVPDITAEVAGRAVQMDMKAPPPKRPAVKFAANHGLCILDLARFQGLPQDQQKKALDTVRAKRGCAMFLPAHALYPGLVGPDIPDITGDLVASAGR